MPGLSVKSKPLVSAKRPYPADIGTVVKVLEDSQNPVLRGAANAFRNVQSSLNELHNVLRNNNPEVTEIVIRDAAGKVVGAIGDFEFGGVITRNYFSEIHIGDPLGTGDPASAVINVNANGQITIGSTGWFDVLDPYGASAAWIGTQFDVLNVTGAVTSGGLIRLTVAGHAFVTGDTAIVMNVGGVPNATGTFTVTNIDATHVDLQASVFVGAYTSGGTITRLLHVTGAVNNGSGLIRLTVTAHGYETGDKVNVGTVGGVSNATGQWTITVITANTFDLRASTFSGTYTSGGTAIRYFAGGLFQQIAVGTSFADYKLRAFPDGTLKLKNAIISLISGSKSITLDPTGPSIVSTDVSGNYVSISDAAISLVASGTLPQENLTYNQINLKNSSNVTVVLFSSNTGTSEAGTLNLKDSAGTSSVQLDPSSATAITTVGGGNINTSGVFRVAGVSGISATRNRYTSISVSTRGDGVVGTPGVGQSNVTVVTGVTLSVIGETISGGIITG